jgi:energy-coupling factor transporter transmembrane protein EcfT
VLALVATFVVSDGKVLIGAWLFVAIPLVVFAHIWRAHLAFVGVFLIPFGLALWLVWVILVGAPPNAELGSDLPGAHEYVARITFRLALITAVVQLCFLTIRPSDFPATLARWGLRGDVLLITLGALALMPELTRRAEQVLTSRYARGYITRPSFMRKLAQVPFLIRPLFAWTLRAALQRSEVWVQRDILGRLADFSPTEELGSASGSTAWLLIAALWFGVAITVNLRAI